MTRPKQPPLVSETEILERLFSPGRRPSLRTFQRWRRDGKIPFVSIGRTPWFVEEKVRQAIERKKLVRAV